MSNQAIKPLHNTPSPQHSVSPRAKADLAKFSIDLGWARGVPSSSQAHNEAYPSPPMSGSPSHHARHIPKNDFDDRGYGGFGGPLPGRQPIEGLESGSSGQEVEDVQRHGMRQNAGSYSSNSQIAAAQYGLYSAGGSGQGDQNQYHYPAQPQRLNQQRPLPPYSFNNNIQPLNSFVSERVPNTAPSEPLSQPKTQRKTKGHVASACVPCKRAHLRCDAMRPCSRCVTGGKEDSCTDVPHKKRGRPRLRDDRENRFDSNLYTRGPELLRRPISIYPGGDGHGLHSSQLNSYRVLKSQAGPSQPVNARFLNHASTSDANIYASPAQQRIVQQDGPYAYLNMDFQIIKATQSFLDSIGFPSVIARKLVDMVDERDKIEQIKQIFEAQKQKREQPQYLPPIHSKLDEDRAIQSVGFSNDELRRIQMDRHGTLTFHAMNGEPRPFDVKLGLGKKDAIFFVTIRLLPAQIQSVQQQQHYPVSNLSNPNFNAGRDQQYGGFQQSFQQPYTPQQFQQYQYASPMAVQPSPQLHTYDEPRSQSMQDQSLMYRPSMNSINTTTPIQQNIPLATSILNSEMSTYSRPSSSQTYGQAQYTPQAPAHSAPIQDMGQVRLQTAQSGDLQLPPIRNQNQGSPTIMSGGNMGMMNSISGMNSVGGLRDDRSSRLDIGGLLERPAGSRRTSRG